jgi:hypothetical protein
MVAGGQPATTFTRQSDSGEEVSLESFRASRSFSTSIPTTTRCLFRQPAEINRHRDDTLAQSLGLGSALFRRVLRRIASAN